MFLLVTGTPGLDDGGFGINNYTLMANAFPYTMGFLVTEICTGTSLPEITREFRIGRLILLYWGFPKQGSKPSASLHKHSVSQRLYA